MREQIPEFAVHTDRGADVFRRVETPNERRHHYECIATVISADATPEVIAYHQDARLHPERMINAATRLHQTPVLGNLYSLGDPRSYPLPDTPHAGFDLLLYLDFFRQWQIKELEISRITNLIKTGGTLKPPDISRLFRLLLDYNQLSHAPFFINAFLPYLLHISHEKKDDRWQNAAYSLRMVGDLQLRAGQAKSSLDSYEASIALGDNAFRRGLAVQAAFAADDRDATRRHLESYERKWRLPEPLAKIKTAIISSEPGETI